MQAKGGKDQIGVVQTTQDIRFVEQKFPGIRCRAISAQFMEDGVIALLELALQGDEMRVVDERHYQLVPADQLGAGCDPKIPRALEGDRTICRSSFGRVKTAPTLPDVASKHPTGWKAGWMGCG